MRLSKDLGVPMYKAVVESAEFAHNFSMTEPPIMYMQKLDAMKAFRPNGWSSTQYMDNGEMRYKFNDKIQETKKKLWNLRKRLQKLSLELRLCRIRYH